MAEDKKTRRQWLYNSETGELTTKEATFDLNLVTKEADLFMKLYGSKQYLVDGIASKGGSEYSDEERASTMQERFSRLCNDKFKLTYTENGFSFKDPDAVATKRENSVGIETLYNGLVKDGMEPEEAAAKVLLWTGKPYLPKE